MSGWPGRFARPLALVLAFASVSAAQDVEPSDADTFTVGRIEFVPVDGSTIRWKNQSYPGTIEVDARSGGLVVITEIEPEAYLIGIREVPSEWPVESLKAQAVAARTYLAWTLSRGRAGSGATYGFDICATTACQVYLGGGDSRWADAVAATEGEILLYDGQPAQALYSSTSGGRTRTVGDVFVSSRDLPYLQAVSSDDEISPFVDWSYSVPEDQFLAILQRAGLSGDVLIDVNVVESEDGEGPWMVEVLSSAGVRTANTWSFRSTMNRWASELYPDDFPARRPNGRRYPQVVLSPTFDVERTVVTEHDSSDTPPLKVEFLIAGHGWGHLVGMSQFGAKARADAGDTYDGILSHYYTGLTPTDFDFPDLVTVGLGWRLDEVAFETGPVDVYVDGELAATGIVGPWKLLPSGGQVAVSPPPGWEVPKELASEATDVTPGSSVVVVEGFVARPGEARIVVYRGNQVVFKTPWTTVIPGSVRLYWTPDRTGTVRVVGQVRYSDGSGGVLKSVLSAS